LFLSNKTPVTGNTETTQPENRAFFPALDGLRAIAFLMVFAQHYYHFPWGWTGVNVFFVLSGFLITGILFDSRDDPHRARTFYVRRTLRIFPLYYGIFLFFLVLQPIMHWRWSWLWIAWPLYLGNFLRFLSPASAVFGSPQQRLADAQITTPRSHILLLPMGHFWSLCVEEQFYLVWPWIVFWVRSRRALIWICSVTVVIVPIARIIVNRHAPLWMLQQELLNRATPFQLDALLLGGLIGLLWRGSHRELLWKIGRVVMWAMIVITAIYCFRTFHVFEPDWCLRYPYPHWRLTWGLTFINVFSAAIILTVLRPVGIVYRFLCLGPLRWLGRISYGAYVLHDIVHLICAHAFFRALNIYETKNGPGSEFLSRHQVVLYPIPAFVVVLLVAWLSFRYFESPFLQLKNRLAPPSASRPADVN
jgi:peptidoglycan/LPS O-acetylase OafA/YrhL